MFGQEVMYDTTPGYLDLGDHDSLIIQLPLQEKIGFQGKATAGTDDDYTALAVSGDNSGFMDICENGTLELGDFVTNPTTPIDLMPMYDPVGKTLTITGPQDFENVKRLDGTSLPWGALDRVQCGGAHPEGGPGAVGPDRGRIRGAGIRDGCCVLGRGGFARSGRGRVGGDSAGNRHTSLLEVNGRRNSINLFHSSSFFDASQNVICAQLSE